MEFGTLRSALIVKYNFMLVPLYTYLQVKLKNRMLVTLFSPWKPGVDAFGLFCVVQAGTGKARL